MDRGKPGSKMHVLSDANGLPLVVGVSAANVHDSVVTTIGSAIRRIADATWSTSPTWAT